MMQTLRAVLPSMRNQPAPWLLALGLVCMFWPVGQKLAHTVWATDDQGHGPIIIGVALWLIWQRRADLIAAAQKAHSSGWLGWPLFAFGLVLYFVGRLQNIPTFELGALIPISVGLVLATYGGAMLRLVGFPLFFLAFAVPLPGGLVDALTMPLKYAVSVVAEIILHHAGLPVGRTGVMLTVGQYQLLVADACAGLNSMFTLEALGILYMNLVGHTNRVRNVVLAILIIPMAFIANVIRVMVLVCVTYYFGDEAGQGVVHGMAGMVLFVVALTLMFAMDKALNLVFKPEKQ
jgi:exosortase B